MVARGLLVALLLSFIFLALYTLLLYLSPLSEAYVPYLIYGGTLLCIFLGSLYVGKRTEEKGWLRGGLTAKTREAIHSVAGAGLLQASAAEAILDQFQRGDIHWSRVWALAALATAT